MSRIHYRYISLEELVERSRCILVVERLQPDQSLEEIPIHQDKNKYPPFSMSVKHFKIIEELFCSQLDSIEHARLDVLPDSYETRLRTHKDYYLKGKSRSYAVDSYIEKDFSIYDRLIVFLALNGKSKNFEFAVRNAYESLDEISLVLEQIKKLSPNLLH